MTATAASSSQINLSWTNNATNQTGFQIDQATSSDFTQNLTTVSVGANVTTYNCHRSLCQYDLLLSCTRHQHRGQFCQFRHRQCHNQAWLSPVVFSVPNYSFENPAQSNGGYSNNNITSWTIGTNTAIYNAGVQNNTGASNVSSVPDGAQFAFINADSNNSPYNSSNTLTSAGLGTVSGGLIYTLTVAVGNRLDTPAANNGTYTISLLDGGTVLASQTYSGSSITPGAWMI